jgi:hypothetical protein
MQLVYILLKAKLNQVNESVLLATLSKPTIFFLMYLQKNS